MWNYSLQPTSSFSVAPTAPTVADQLATAMPRYSPEQVAQLQSLIRLDENRGAAEQALQQIDAAGLRNTTNDSFAALDIINNVLGNPVQPNGAEPLGADAMTASVTTLDVAVALGEQRLLEQSGRDSTNARDIELMKPRIENRVKELMAAGASREEIERVARNYGVTPALADIAAEIATQQYDANRNPLADANMAAGQNFLDEEMRRQNSYRPLSYPIGPMAQPQISPTFATMTTVAAVLDTGNGILGDLAPTQGLPNLKGGPSRGGPDFA